MVIFFLLLPLFSSKYVTFTGPVNLARAQITLLYYKTKNVRKAQFKRSENIKKKLKFFCFLISTKKLGIGVFWVAEFIFHIYFGILRHFSVILEQFSKNMKKYDLLSYN